MDGESERERESEQFIAQFISISHYHHDACHYIDPDELIEFRLAEIEIEMTRLHTV